MKNKIITLKDKFAKQAREDIFFLSLAKKVASESKCLSRKIGSVLVKDGVIISTGRNGPARNVTHCNNRSCEFYFNLDKSLTKENQESYKKLWNNTICPRRNLGYKSGEGLCICNAVHSERNCILAAARNGISTLGTTIYAFCPMPCKDCTSELINAGVREIVCLKGEDYDGYARIIAQEAGIIIREIDKELL